MGRQISFLTDSFLADITQEISLLGVTGRNTVLGGVINTGIQISVVRADLVADILYDREGKIDISSGFRESEITPLRILERKVKDDLHDIVPVTCDFSKRLVIDLLLSSCAHKMLIENVEFHRDDHKWKMPLPEKET
ncbi:retrovirus-related Pol polyprotein from transposon opus [Caerostris darwini]|uniref:Retrovirus-related Pol polyprotein from transposon opus n=1 Tax=Caerostris darwini TaxID=1538125 RepID=A0AAV4PAB6_9ARAC|nr:retrovirus-related Pol polyprotein from transposon opus [Caerostris darwini]